MDRLVHPIPFQKEPASPLIGYYFVPFSPTPTFRKRWIEAFRFACSDTTIW